MGSWITLGLPLSLSWIWWLFDALLLLLKNRWMVPAEKQEVQLKAEVERRWKQRTTLQLCFLVFVSIFNAFHIDSQEWMTYRNLRTLVLATEVRGFTGLVSFSAVGRESLTQIWLFSSEGSILNCLSLWLILKRNTLLEADMKSLPVAQCLCIV